MREASSVFIVRRTDTEVQRSGTEVGGACAMYVDEAMQRCLAKARREPKAEVSNSRLGM